MTTPAPSDPRLSVLTAVRNGLEHLDQAIESIRAQTLRDWEWVIVDDGSTDGTGDRLLTWARRDPRIRPFSRGPEGLVAALNAGLTRCRGALVARMDADDIALPERLALQTAALDTDPQLTVVDGRVELFGGERNDGMRRYVVWLNDHADHQSIADDIFVESPIVHPAAAYRRAAVAAGSGYRAGDFPEDYDLWLRLHAGGARFGKLPQTILRWRDHPRRLTRTDRRYRDSAFTALKQQALWELEGAAMTGRGIACGGEADGGMVLWGAARATRCWRQWLRRQGVQPTFIVDANPKRHGHTILDAPVLDPAVLPRRPWSYLLVTVSSPDARAEIRQRLAGWQLHPGPTRRIRFV
jgi:cellulose synthase/poly-beta-1,6-N-acetylglucosamine synthase-like glycosyltransferase